VTSNQIAQQDQQTETMLAGVKVGSNSLSCFACSSLKGLFVMLIFTIFHLLSETNESVTSNQIAQQDQQTETMLADKEPEVTPETRAITILYRC
jgi:hypothetical protein